MTKTTVRVAGCRTPRSGGRERGTSHGAAEPAPRAGSGPPAFSREGPASQSRGSPASVSAGNQSPPRGLLTRGPASFYLRADGTIPPSLPRETNARTGRTHRVVRDPRPARRGGHGRGLPRARHRASGARSRSRSFPPSAWPTRTDAALRPGGPRRLRTQSPAHRHHPRDRVGRRRSTSSSWSTSRGRPWLRSFRRTGCRHGDALRIAIPIADALAAAHAARHRPPRPQARQRRRHSRGVVKVLDFGLAKLVSDDPGGPTGTFATLSAAEPLSRAGGDHRARRPTCRRSRRRAARSTRAATSSASGRCSTRW